MLSCTQPCKCALSQPVANRHSRSAPPRSRSADNGTQPNKSGAAPGPEHAYFFAIFIWSRALLSLQSRSRFSDRIFQKFPNASVFDVFYVKPNSPYSLVQIFPTSSSKSAFDPFQVRLAAAAVLCIFCRRLSQIRGNRHPTSANNILKMYHRQTRRVVSRQYITNTRQ